MKIVSYLEMKTDKFKSNIGNPKLTIDFSKEVDISQYEVLEEFKRNNPNIVRCIPLDEINSFSLTVKPTEEEYKILNKNGFVINGTDEYGNDFYVRKELLDQIKQSLMEDI